MNTLPQPSLTGSGTTRASTHAPEVSKALARIRIIVLAGCWVVGAALLTQAIVASLTYFTDLRWTNVEPLSQSPIVVSSDETPTVFSPLDAGAPLVEVPTVDPNFVPSKFNRIFELGTVVAAGFGNVGLLAILPFIALGVMLAAASATRGVEHAVSSFMWAIVLTLLVWPLAGKIGLPWYEGAFPGYGQLVAHYEQLPAAESEMAGLTVPQRLDHLVYLARFIALPITCIIGVMLTGWRFSTGIELGLLPPEDLRLDRLLEREAGNIKASSLHGTNRIASAMPTVLKETPATGGAPSGPSAEPKRPRRLI